MRRAAFAPLAALLAGLATLGPASAQPAAEPGRLHVLGRASLELPPDFASVQVGVASRGATAAAALADNATAARRVYDVAKSSGIEERDLATAAVNLAPTYRTVRDPSGASQQQPDGYAATNSVTVRVRDLPKLGDLLRRLVETGANRIDGVSFGLNEPGKALEDAQAAAVADAVRRAGRIATAAGVSLGAIEDIAAPPRVESRPLALAAPMMRRAAAPATAVPVEAGTVEVAAEVDLTVRLVQP